MNKLRKYIYRGCAVLCLGTVIIGGDYVYKHNRTFEYHEELLYSNKTNDIVADDYSKYEKKGTVVNVESILNVRREPSVDSPIGNTLDNGETINIVDEKEGWYEIEGNDNVIGYVKSDYVEEHNQEYQPVTLDVKTDMKEEQTSQAPVQDLTNTSQSEAENSTQNQVNVETVSVEEKSAETPKGKKINVELTAYCNDEKCSGKWGGKTALGTETRVGVVAAPSSISLGSKLYIPELSYYKADSVFDVEDRGGAVKTKEDGTYIVDVWFPTHEQVEKFGRIKATAYILE